MGMKTGRRLLHAFEATQFRTLLIAFLSLNVAAYAHRLGEGALATCYFILSLLYLVTAIAEFVSGFRRARS
jgi:hypothetical protein